MQKCLTTELSKDVDDFVTGKLTDPDAIKALIFELAVGSERSKHSGWSWGELVGYVGTIDEQANPYRDGELSHSFDAGFIHGASMRE